MSSRELLIFQAAVQIAASMAQTHGAGEAAWIAARAVEMATRVADLAFAISPAPEVKPG